MNKDIKCNDCSEFVDSAKSTGSTPTNLTYSEEDEGIEFITANTSFSDKVATDTRGVAVSEVLLARYSRQTHLAILPL